MAAPLLGSRRPVRREAAGGLAEHPVAAARMARDVGEWHARHGMVVVASASTQVPKPCFSLTEVPFPDWAIHEMEDQGLEGPTPLQAQAWPVASLGLDLAVRAPADSGHILAYAMPLLTRVQARPGLGSHVGPQGLVVVPTQRAAAHILGALSPFARSAGLEVGALPDEGAQDGRSLGALLSVSVLVATPQRLAQVFRLEPGVRQYGPPLGLVRVAAIVIDGLSALTDLEVEALDRLMSALPAKRQRMSFSAHQPGGDAARLLDGWSTGPLVQLNLGAVGMAFSSKVGIRPTRPGDWFCEECNEHQFARNRECRDCGAPRLRQASCSETRSASRRRPPGGPLGVRKSPGWRPGDWQCSGCSGHQFARNTSCRYCGQRRPACPLSADPQETGVAEPVAARLEGEGRSKSSCRGRSKARAMYGEVPAEGAEETGEAFLVRVGLADNEEAQDTLRRLPSPLRARVICEFNAGSRTRNVLRRLCAFAGSVASGGGRGGPARAQAHPMPGAGLWRCDVCGEHQPVSRERCRVCFVQRTPDHTRTPDLEKTQDSPAVHPVLPESQSARVATPMWNRRAWYMHDAARASGGEDCPSGAGSRGLLILSPAGQHDQCDHELDIVICT